MQLVPGQEKLGRRTMSEEIAHVLRSEIQRGTLGPGTRLKQGEVSDRLGVSTTPVREAFTILRAQGFVTLDPYKGVVVFSPSTREVSELYEIRRALEVLAVELAIPNLTDEELRELQRTVDEMRATDDNERWLELNGDFHGRLYESADRPRLSALIDGLREASNSYLHMFISNTDRSRADDEHQTILDACKEGDSARASEALTMHLRHTLEVVRGFLDALDNT